MYRRRPFSALRDFLNQEAAGGYVLMAAAALALLAANTAVSDAYFSLLNWKVGFAAGPVQLRETVLHWVNDGLMAVFFFLIGLEIKREVLDGQLSRPSRLILPGLCAAAGLALPALIYVGLNRHDPTAVAGWAVPAATDIAFALGVLSLAGKSVPTSLKILLTAIAVLDDLAAILIIAFFYTDELRLWALGGAASVVAILVVMNRLRVHALWPYLALGVVLWWLVFESGVHATLAGVALAMTIPIVRSPGRPDAYKASPLHRLEHKLHKPVALLVVPIFGFANAGLSFRGLAVGDLLTPIPLGVALGLFVGKQVGVFFTAWAVIRLGWSQTPKYASLGQLYGLACLCGVGFTMSLFIGGLAFDDPLQVDAVKLGVLAGSLASALVGFACLRIFAPRVEALEGAAGGPSPAP